MMYSSMHLNTYELDHIYFSVTRFYMTFPMVAPMALIMLWFMRGMYQNKKAESDDCRRERHRVYAGFDFRPVADFYRRQSLYAGDDSASLDCDYDEPTRGHQRSGSAKTRRRNHRSAGQRNRGNEAFAGETGAVKIRQITMPMLDFDIEKMDGLESYRLLASLVVPRPIAFVTTINDEDLVNAAPYSFFNMMGSDPPIIAVNIARNSQRELDLKDTGRNILNNGEFVVNVVSEDILRQMNIAATDFPADVSEIPNANLHLAASLKIKPPCIAEAAANFECRHIVTNEIGRNRVTIGEIVHLHLNEEFYDAKTRHVLTEKIGIIGRMHGGAGYTKTNEIIELPRVSFKNLQARKDDENELH